VPSSLVSGARYGARRGGDKGKRLRVDGVKPGEHARAGAETDFAGDRAIHVQGGCLFIGARRRTASYAGRDATSLRVRWNAAHARGWFGFFFSPNRQHRTVALAAAAAASESSAQSNTRNVVERFLLFKRIAHA
jgi:hypothetical protein